MTPKRTNLWKYGGLAKYDEVRNSSLAVRTYQNTEADTNILSTVMKRVPVYFKCKNVDENLDYSNQLHSKLRRKVISSGFSPSQVTKTKMSPLYYKIIGKDTYSKQSMIQRYANHDRTDRGKLEYDDTGQIRSIVSPQS